VNTSCATIHTTTQNHYNESITGHKKLKKLDNEKIGNLKRIGIIKRDEDAGNL